MKKHKNHETRTVSLRVKIALTAIITLCSACCFSGLLVILGFHFLYDHPMTSAIAAVMCLIVCTLTMIIGGFSLWHVALFVTKPVQRINEGVRKVADGDFTVQLTAWRKYRNRQEAIYPDEIDELANNFNKMVRELNGMDYMRKDFMSNVSHEIKTPVAAITGFSEILLDGGLQEQEQIEYLTYLNQESLRLSRLCDNMLQMSRLDNQIIVDRNQEINVDEQLRHCIIMLGEKWSEKEIHYELKLDKCKIVSDSDLLFQIWINLIDNAIKYSKQEGVLWIVARLDQENLIVSIRDEGIGIPIEKLNKIYDKFYQCEESHKKQGGGLGLSIVKRIVELLKGTILCESSIGKGTTMTVVLPIKLN